ncbi:MAG: hypothetical protein EI684_14810 [Candidatus Viridilinea halotolerans]|uniref:ESX secretion-associated protein EspG n=1 Tax=Candidatus Viridilinea halotolerans TaxID=2491704 RepID=A0A426TWJ9_9CHLR|nr:MAG: hypothetical protein EI684_14810 [Candidatus Viridilinea halotolerans]
MHTDAVQLSHEELLLVLALLKLPTPLALGPRPADGFEALGLGAALAAASSSLVARDLAYPGASLEQPPTPVPALAALASAVALAEGCLFLAERRGAERRTSHLSVQGSNLVLHTAPVPRIHRLARMADATVAITWLTEQISTPEAAHGPSVRAPVATLASALEALEAGHVATAEAQLAAAGVAESHAFVAAVGPQPTRFVLAAMRRLQAPVPVGRAALALCGPNATWWGASDPDLVELRPLGAKGLQRELHDLVGWMQE